jgi:hypothetical protein
MFTTHLNSITPYESGRASHRLWPTVLIVLALFGIPEVASAAGPVKLSAAKAEVSARSAIAPLKVEAARCVAIAQKRGRQRKLCVLRHADAGSQVCTSWVIVTAPGRAKVETRNACFPALVFDGIAPRSPEETAAAAVAPLEVVASSCARIDSSRTLCVLSHAAPAGRQCSSFGLVPDSGAPTVQSRNVCSAEFQPAPAGS